MLLTITMFPYGTETPQNCPFPRTYAIGGRSTGSLTLQYSLHFPPITGHITARKAEHTLHFNPNRSPGYERTYSNFIANGNHQAARRVRVGLLTSCTRFMAR